MKSIDQELVVLFDAACDGRASEDEIRQLQERIRGDLEVCDAYLQYVDLHANLALDCIGTDAGQIVAFSTGRRAPIAKGPLAWAGLSGIAAALVVWGVSASTKVEPELQNYIAVVTNAEGALWEGDDASVMVGSALKAGLVELCEGRVEIELDSGVQLAIEGPARFELVDEKGGLLHQGKLSAHVPPEGIGFTVETPTMEVIDLGTEFGLNVTAHACEVHVFDGEVEAVLRQSPESPLKELITTSLTRRVQRASSGQLEAVSFNPDRFTPPPVAVAGVNQVWGGIRLLGTQPETVQKGTYQHSYILLFLEQAHVELEDPLEVSCIHPGRYLVGFQPEKGDEFRHMLQVGQRVDSYFLHYDTESETSSRCRGTVRFDRPIVAVIAGGRQMGATDELLGAWCTAYDHPTVSDRGLEDDEVVISGDRRRLTLDWGVGKSADQIRVLVAAD